MEEMTEKGKSMIEASLPGLRELALEARQWEQG